MPGDLNLKKSWHPGLVKNQQKIWQQEQDALKEHQKIKERQKELEEEREKEELIRLQYGDDIKSIPSEKKVELNKLGWMYDTPNKNSSGFNEMSGEFLEGKKKVEDMLSGRSMINVQSSRLEKVIGTKPSSSGNALSFGDDPLMKIKQQVRISRHKSGPNGTEKDRESRSSSSRHSSSRDSSSRHRDRRRYERQEKEHRSSSDRERSHRDRSHRSGDHRSSDRKSRDKSPTRTKTSPTAPKEISY
ncbi:pre-mRNA-splicing factor Cwc25p [[Candida] anglica]|uniref:Pre-mRNA-splicing factor CWC25 n=1 Tax=[Candida] anglica TaxID=148631 RepID=A0ABP0EEP6_9ASCO